MKPQILLDTGPLVAFLDRRDKDHDFRLYRKQGRRVVPVVMPHGR